MNKRVSARAVIIEGDFLYAMFRRRIKDGVAREYYVIPGGGIEENETFEDGVIREIKEEFSVDIKINDYLGSDESDSSIAHFFKCEIASGIPSLGGEELGKCSPENYYEIKKVPLSDIDKIDISSRDMILKAIDKGDIKLKTFK